MTESARAAALELLVEGGISAVTVRAVAQRAGVGLPSLYRRWPTKDDLLVDALAVALDRAAPTPDTGSLRGDLISMSRSAATALAGKGADAAVVALVTGALPGADELRVRIQLRRRRENRVVVQRAVERGELAADVDADLLLDMLHGPLWLERVAGGRAPDLSRLEALVDALLRAFLPATDPSPRARRATRRGAER